MEKWLLATGSRLLPPGILAGFAIRHMVALVFEMCWNCYMVGHRAIQLRLVHCLSIVCWDFRSQFVAELFGLSESQVVVVVVFVFFSWGLVASRYLVNFLVSVLG